jgi:hypothetical protein
VLDIKQQSVSYSREVEGGVGGGGGGAPVTHVSFVNCEILVAAVFNKKLRYNLTKNDIIYTK